jgi:phage shock protein PspC (stress-responsive transcriptional regulator)
MNRFGAQFLTDQSLLNVLFILCIVFSVCSMNLLLLKMYFCLPISVPSDEYNQVQLAFKI